jgi:thiol-disulfide isomerase/thioredoxin
VRFRFAATLCALALAIASAAAADDIISIHSDGAAGWTTAVPNGAGAGQPGATPLTAPVWFARFPDAKIPLATGGSFDLAGARGKVLLLDYWASWCGPCIKELPHLQKLHLAHEGEGLVAVAINADEDAAAASASAKKLGLTMMIGLNDKNVYRMLGVRNLPTVFIIDKQGRLRSRWDGYRTGLENEIDATVAKLLADDETGTTREVASVVSGPGLLRARWFRDLPEAANGVVGLPAGLAGGMRVVASSGDELLTLDAGGEALARLKTTNASGRLLDFGAAADGTRELLGYRPGATSVGVIALRSGDERAIALPAPVLGVAIASEGIGDKRRIAFSTLRGAATCGPNDTQAALLEGAGGVRSVAARPGLGILALREDGSIGPLEDSSKAWSKPVPGAANLLAAREEAAVVGPKAAIASVSGSFLAQGGRQLAVATFSGHLLLLDEASGRVVFDSVWTGIHDLSAVDLDGDGHDELLVAAGRSVTALSSTGH